MSRVFLIRPRWPYPRSQGDPTYNRVWFPLSLATCSSLLKLEGVETHLYDFHGMRTLDMAQVIRDIRDDDCVFITSGDIDRWQCPPVDLAPVIELSKLVRQKTSHLYLLGPHGTMNPKSVLRHTGANAVLRGEPEFALLQVVRKCGPSAVRGVTYLEGTKAVHNPPAREVHLDRLPSPDYSLLRQVNYNYEIFGDRLALIETSRGCPHRCAFCMKAMYGHTYREKSVKRVLDEVALARNHGARRAGFIDLDMGANRNHLLRICSALREEQPGFEWWCQARIDSVDRETLELMAGGGCRLIHFGVESGNQGILDGVGKGLDLAEVKDVLADCRRNGISTLGFFLLGMPNESLEHMKQTIKFALGSDFTFLSIHHLLRYRTTPLHDCGSGPFHNKVASSDLKKIDRLRRDAYLRHYLRPQALFRCATSGAFRNLSVPLRLFFGSL